MKRLDELLLGGTRKRTTFGSCFPQFELNDDRSYARAMAVYACKTSARRQGQGKGTGTRSGTNTRTYERKAQIRKYAPKQSGVAGSNRRRGADNDEQEHDTGPEQTDACVWVDGCVCDEQEHDTDPKQTDACVCVCACMCV